MFENYVASLRAEEALGTVGAWTWQWEGEMGKRHITNHCIGPPVTHRLGGSEELPNLACPPRCELHEGLLLYVNK